MLQSLHRAGQRWVKLSLEAAMLPLYQRGRKAGQPDDSWAWVRSSEQHWFVPSGLTGCNLWSLRKPYSNAQCKHTQSYPTWNHARPLAWNPFYKKKKRKKKPKMIWVNKKGHVAEAIQEIWVLFLALPNPGDDNPLFTFFLYLDCKFLKTETVSWYCLYRVYRSVSGITAMIRIIFNDHKSLRPLFYESFKDMHVKWVFIKRIWTNYKIHTTIFLHASFCPAYPARNQIPVFLAVTYFLELWRMANEPWCDWELCAFPLAHTWQRIKKSNLSFYTIKNKTTKKSDPKQKKTKLNTPPPPHPPPTRDREKFNNTSEERRQTEPSCNW